MKEEKSKYKAYYPNGDTKIFEYDEKPSFKHLYKIIGTDMVEAMAGTNHIWWVDEEAMFKKDIEHNPYVGCLGTAVELIGCEFD